MSNPHDALFRHVFDDPARALDLLRAVLPAALVRELDASSLERQPQSFVDAELRDHQADLLFEAKLGSGRVLVYVLLEHKSGAEPLTPLQILRYLVRIWESWCRQHPHADKLPAIIPLVIHHGERPWHAPRRLVDCIATDGMEEDTAEALLSLQPRLDLLIDDLAASSEAEILARTGSALSRLTLLFLERLRHLDPDAVLLAIARWARLVAEVVAAADARAVLPALWFYLLDVTEVDTEPLREVVARVTNPLEVETIMSTANRLRAEGRAEGRTEGRAIGEVEGEAKGRAALVLTQLESKFGALDAELTDRVRRGTNVELESWALRLLDAQTLESVFRGS